MCFVNHFVESNQFPQMIFGTCLGIPELTSHPTVLDLGKSRPGGFGDPVAIYSQEPLRSGGTDQRQ